MKSDSPIHNRKNPRLTAYDYSDAGSYFLTICTRNHDSFFGIVQDGKMLFNDVSHIAIKCWQNLPERFRKVSLDEFVLMPNHFHGIINISDNKGVINHAPTGNRNEFVGAQFIAPKKYDATDQGVINHASTLGMIVRTFKALASRKIHLSGKDEFNWQRNYYEHIIRNEDSLNYIREYIITNPLRWELDRENPDRKGEDQFDRWLNSMGAINIKSGRDESRPYRGVNTKSGRDKSRPYRG
jgi:putative transposase